MKVKLALAELRDRLGPGKVFTGGEALDGVVTDATRIAGCPDGVVFPETVADVREVVMACHRHRVPLVPRGGGVGYSGGAVAASGGIVLSFVRMNRILEIDPASFLAVVEPGVLTATLQDEAVRRGLFYPPDPASRLESTIGGNVAENAGGPRCFKYGVTGNYVLKLEGFLMNGEPFAFGTRTLKNVAGYDLKALLVGSEGTLAVVTRITLRLLPKPESNVLFRLDFASLAAGAEFVVRAAHSGLDPAGLEFMDRSSLEAAARFLGVPLAPEVEALVLMELDGSATEVAERAGRCREILAEGGVLRWTEATDPAEQDALWRLRRSLSEAVATLRPRKINEDVVVPLGKVPEAVAGIRRIAAAADLLVVMFGHLGDGNIHTNLLVDPADAGETERAEAALPEIFSLVLSLGGSITGEHGVGLAKKPFMPLQFSPQELDLFRRIKGVFDPDGLLNPGKIC